MATLEELRTQAATFLQQRFPRPPGTEELTFSTFRPEQVEEATELARQFSAIAARRGDEQGVADVIGAATVEVTRRLPAIVKYALLVFLTHDPIGARVGAPSLEERHPRAVESMVATRMVRTADDPTSLSFFREDVIANDHHAHWHLVYRIDQEVKERQGELFIYMHQQMLARYQTEALAVGRPALEAIDLRPPGVLAEGYDPHLEGSFGTRADNVALPGAGDLHGRQEEFLNAITGKAFERALERGAVDPAFDATGPQPALTLLGSTIEAEGQPMDFPGLNLHNDGHVYIAGLGRDPDGNVLDGVMADTSVAIRDPIFWRWHKLIDDVAASWQEAQAPRDFTLPEDAAPPLIIRGDAGVESPDIILCTAKAMALGDLTDIAAGEDFGTSHFGAGHWDEDFADKPPGTSALETHMTKRPWNGTEIEYLDFLDEFAYLFRVENSGQDSLEVTARVFIVADEWREDRRKWIEMDKFLRTVPPGRSVLYQPSSLSSVVRKPANRPPGPAPPEDGHESSAYCQCGWPYNLLLPRGRAEGMKFHLLVMFTDAGWDKGHEEDCGSMSFCGVRDRRYPDGRNMGYPFDRPFAGGLTQTLLGLPTVAMRSLTIKRLA